MSKASMVPPVTPHSVCDSVLQVRNYAGNDCAEYPPPPFQCDQDYDDEARVRTRAGSSDYDNENGGLRFWAGRDRRPLFNARRN